MEKLVSLPEGSPVPSHGARQASCLRVNDYDLAYLEQGTGDPLILVHGSLSDYRHWLLQMDAFASGGWCSIAVSLRHYWPEPSPGPVSGVNILTISAAPRSR